MPKEKLSPLLKVIDRDGAIETCMAGPKKRVRSPLDREDDDDVDDVEASAAGLLYAFCQVTVDAFFDNDLFMTTKLFMKHAKGSFGLTVTSTLDAYRQMCMAARGQTVRLCWNCVYVCVCVCVLVSTGQEPPRSSRGSFVLPPGCDRCPSRSTPTKT